MLRKKVRNILFIVSILILSFLYLTISVEQKQELEGFEPFEPENENQNNDNQVNKAAVVPPPPVVPFVPNEALIKRDFEPTKNEALTNEDLELIKIIESKIEKTESDYMNLRNEIIELENSLEPENIISPFEKSEISKDLDVKRISLEEKRTYLDSLNKQLNEI